MGCVWIALSPVTAAMTSTALTVPISMSAPSSATAVAIASSAALLLATTITGFGPAVVATVVVFLSLFALFLLVLLVLPLVLLVPLVVLLPLVVPPSSFPLASSPVIPGTRPTALLLALLYLGRTDRVQSHIDFLPGLSDATRLAGSHDALGGDADNALANGQQQV